MFPVETMLRERAETLKGTLKRTGYNIFNAELPDGVNIYLGFPHSIRPQMPARVYAIADNGCIAWASAPASYYPEMQVTNAVTKALASLFGRQEYYRTSNNHPHGLYSVTRWYDKAEESLNAQRANLLPQERKDVSNLTRIEKREAREYWQKHGYELLFHREGRISFAPIQNRQRRRR